MVQSKSKSKSGHNGRRGKDSNNGNNNGHLKRFASMGKVSANIINRLDNPVDSMSRFLNLALQNIEEDSQSRQFILESKTGLRRMSTLLKKLSTYTKKMEKDFIEISRERM